MKKLFLNGNSIKSGDPTLKLDRPYWAHPSIEISTTVARGNNWVYIALPLLENNKIESVTLYFQNSSQASYIAQTRLTMQLKPDTATVMHDDPSDLNSIFPASYKSIVGGLVVKGSIVLDLKLFFGNTSDKIKIGAIEIEYK